MHKLTAHLGHSVLILLCLLSALGIVYSQHLTRGYFSEIQAIGIDRDQFNSERTKLLLEQSAWASDGRVDSIARQQLDMVFPEQRLFIREQP